LLANVKLVENGCNLLANLLALKSNIDPIISTKGIDVLNKVGLTYPNDPNAVLHVFRGLSNIALCSEEHRLQCIKAESDKDVKKIYENPQNVKDQPQIVNEGKLCYINLTT